MQKFINKAENITSEMLEGLALAHPDILELEQGSLVVNKKLAQAERVTIVTIGGTGNEPAVSGFVGEGMVDVAAIGDVFAAPGPSACLKAVQMADRGQGVLLVVPNHTGAVLTSNIVLKEAQKLGLNVMRVVVQDDIGDVAQENAAERRGFVGCVPVYKVAGAAAQAGKTLTEVAAIAQKFAENMVSLGVAIRSAIHPQTGEQLLAVNEGMMKVGVGQHGEGGAEQPLPTADEAAAVMLDILLENLNVQAGEKLLVIVSGSGATTLMEQLIVFRACHKLLTEKGIEVAASYVGELLTVQEAAGVQLCLARMDTELLDYWNAPCYTAYYKN